MNPAVATLVFDWGETLMRVFPQYSGPMSAWPEVEATPGAAQALERLKDHYRLVVATNAADSHARQVRQALARAGLDGHLSACFTAHELGARKPDEAFFRALESVLRQEPRQLVMIGDSYRDDVLGAFRAGWTAAWYNPAAQAAPGLLPLHDLEITRLEDLPAALAAPRLPGYDRCLAWLQEEAVPHALLAHVHGVAAAAYQMAVWLRERGEAVNPLLAHRGGLLHDLAKVKASGRQISHGELAGLMLDDRGQAALAEIARRHMLPTLEDERLRPRTWEEMLVYFADKLIEGSRLVDLDERIAGLHRRYPQDSREINAITPALHALKETICGAAGMGVDELIPRLRKAFSATTG